MRKRKNFIPTSISSSIGNWNTSQSNQRMSRYIYSQPPMLMLNPESKVLKEPAKITIKVANSIVEKLYVKILRLHPHQES